MKQQSAGEYLRHGQSPFFRLNATTSYDSVELGAVLLGVPWDSGVTYRGGARFAPYELRRVSALLQTFHPVHGIDVFGSLGVIDGGNIVTPPFSAEHMRAAVQAEVQRAVEAKVRPILVGGDHSVALGAMRALQEAHGQMAVIHVDAHLDTSTPELWGEAFHHGTPIRHALEEGLIERGQLHQVGIRATWGHPEEGALSASYDARKYTVGQLNDRSLRDTVQRIKALIADRPVYISFDIDAVDPAFAPGTGTPVPGGLTSHQALSFMRELAGIRLEGMDLVEVSPPLDHADITLHLGAHLLYEGLALMALAPERS